MKIQINNLKDYAELAWASYFYFDFLNTRNIFELDSNQEKIQDKNSSRDYREVKINLEHIISQKYKDQEVLINLKKDDTWQSRMLNFLDEKTNYDKLNGEFGELQARNFSQRYEIKFHQPNTLSGFSATLFYDMQKDKFIVGFRGTENLVNIDVMQDLALSLNSNLQSPPLLEFLEQVDKIVKNENKNIIFVGHSLGGYLAQMALIYCDNKYKDRLSLSPNEVYTFNAPSVHGWNFPNVIINLNTIKILRDILGKYTIDISEKITHIYDNGGVKIIASAQYGANNALGIYTGKNEHSIKPLVYTLYFYSYLLELKENEAKVIKNNSLKEGLENLNHFMKNIEIYTQTFVLKNNTINRKNFGNKNGHFGFFRNHPKKINHFECFLSLIATIVQETNGIFQEVEDYYTSYNAPVINQTKIIDFILKVQEKEKYILILNQSDFNKYRKDCSFINNQENLAYKIAIGDFRVFIVVYQDIKCLENISNIAKIYGYNSKIYKIKDQIWDEQYLGGVCKISQALYFSGKAKIGII